MVDSGIVKEWLDKADEDFSFASSYIEDKDQFFGQICFHFQQAAEKYLKAFIVAEELGFEKIHDLLKLLKICQGKEPSLSNLREDCELLNPFYIETRYPVHWPTHYTREEALNAQKATKRIAEDIKAMLRRETRKD
ncbi:MAG: HEPN domain-containing protein [bacterium]|nr:HEPN domain-containing protein [bacterium]